MSFLLSVKDLNILTEMTCLLHRFQGLCMAYTTLYIHKNAYYIQIFTLCNCIMYISSLTCRQRVTHKLVKDGPEHNTVTDLNDCLWRTPRHWTELRPGAQGLVVINCGLRTRIKLNCNAEGKACSTESCSCHKNNMSCTVYCACSAVDGYCNPFTMKEDGDD